MSESGTFIGYDDEGNPVAVAVFAPRISSRKEALRFASGGTRQTKLFLQGDPTLPAEMERFSDYLATRTPGADQ